MGFIVAILTLYLIGCTPDTTTSQVSSIELENPTELLQLAIETTQQETSYQSSQNFDYPVVGKEIFMRNSTMCVHNWEIETTHCRTEAHMNESIVTDWEAVRSPEHFWYLSDDGKWVDFGTPSVTPGMAEGYIDALPFIALANNLQAKLEGESIFIYYDVDDNLAMSKQLIKNWDGYYLAPSLFPPLDSIEFSGKIGLDSNNRIISHELRGSSEVNGDTLEILLDQSFSKYGAEVRLPEVP